MSQLQRPNRAGLVIVLIVATCAVALGSFALIRAAGVKSSPTGTHIVIKQDGPSDTTTVAATSPANIAMRGDNVAGNLNLSAPIMDLSWIGTITGGGVVGTIKVSAQTAKWLGILSGLAALLSAVSGTVKWLAKDYIHAIGQFLSALALFVGAWDTEVLGWCFVISWFVSFASHVAPSAAAKTENALKQYISTLWAKAPQAAKDVAAEMEGKSAVIVAKAGG